MLAECLDSVLAQSWADYEVVMKDGCLSAPARNSTLLNRHFKELGTRLRYILSEDSGIFPGFERSTRASDWRCSLFSL